MQVFSLMKKMDVAFAGRARRIHDKDRTKRIVICVRGSISMMLSYPNRPQRFLTNLTRFPLLSAPEKERDVLLGLT